LYCSFINDVAKYYGTFGIEHSKDNVRYTIYIRIISATGIKKETLAKR